MKLREWREHYYSPCIQKFPSSGDITERAESTKQSLMIGVNPKPHASRRGQRSPAGPRVLDRSPADGGGGGVVLGRAQTVRAEI